MNDADLVPAHLRPPFDPDWKTNAVCRDADTDLFYPTARGDRAIPTYRQLAAAFCHRCTVRPACLWSALGSEAGTPSKRHGLSGALSPRRRNNLSLVLLVLSGQLPPPPPSALCACGCDRALPADLGVGRPRRWIDGHQPHKAVAA